MPKRIGRPNNFAAREAFDELVEDLDQYFIDERLRTDVARTDEERARMLARAVASRDRAWEAFQRVVAELLGAR